ncbi:MAG TPA: 3'(2'),5'-bisphosphate nucleotidase CysQ [Longimicrobiales bacterium]|nr:3'(2'),5'-bisphosphate nucleotidase CysQ [Longimicrobiales bacterium]
MTHEADRTDDLARIDAALRAAAEAVAPFTPGAVAWETKAERGDPLTAADLAVDGVLREMLPRAGEGWLSEETVDDHARLACERVWIVDPIDGTREFVEGIPEWCISIGLVERGRPVVGGILNPATDQLVLGAVGHGVTLNGTPVDPDTSASLEGARVLASRSEVRRGEWDRYAGAGFEVVPCGSVAYKLGQVAAGLAEATWTLVPKHEWDVAGGAALIRAAGLHLSHADGSERTFNQADSKLPNFLAGPAGLLEKFRARWV